MSVAQHELLGAPLDAGPFLIDASQEPAAGQAKPDRIDDAQHDQVRAPFEGKLDGPVRRMRRGGREVGRQDDLRGAAVIATRQTTAARVRSSEVHALVGVDRRWSHVPIIRMPADPSQ